MHALDDYYEHAVRDVLRMRYQPLTCVNLDYPVTATSEDEKSIYLLLLAIVLAVIDNIIMKECIWYVAFIFVLSLVAFFCIFLYFI